MAALEVADAIAIPLDEFRFETSRSGGPGGQNVNKVNSKVAAPLEARREPEPARAGARTGCCRRSPAG